MPLEPVLLAGQGNRAGVAMGSFGCGESRSITCASSLGQGCRLSGSSVFSKEASFRGVLRDGMSQ